MVSDVVAVNVRLTEVVGNKLNVVVAALAVFDPVSVFGGVLVSVMVVEIVPDLLRDMSSVSETEKEADGPVSLREGESVMLWLKV